MSYQELSMRLVYFKHKLNMHYATRNSNNVDSKYIQYLEDRINEVINLMSQIKKAG